MHSQESIRFVLSENDYVDLLPNGARVKKLVLDGVTVIQGLKQYTDLGSGNYLMYPWVNRLEKVQQPYQPVFRDGNGYPIHGLVVNAPMKITAQNKQNKIIITARPNPLTPPQMPDFTQTFTLQPKRFTIHLNIEGKSTLPVCFGYHPYFQINDAKLSDLTFETNLKNNIKLDSKLLLPIIPFEQNQIEIVSTGKYDNLFKHQGKDQPFFKLVHPNGKSVQVRSPDMIFWQIYTPSDGKRIAVQPMTFIGNLYTIYSEQKFGKLPNEGTFTISVK